MVYQLCSSYAKFKAFRSLFTMKMWDEILISWFANILTLHNSFQVLEHYENPRNVGSLDKKDKNVGTGLVGAPACGDVMKLQIRVDDDGKIVEAKFKTFGCGSAIGKSFSVAFHHPPKLTKIFYFKLRARWQQNGSREKLWIKLELWRTQTSLRSCVFHLWSFIVQVNFLNKHLCKR